MGIARRQIRWNGWGWAAHQDALADHEPLWRWLAAEMGMPALLATPARPLDDILLPTPGLTAQQIAGFAAILGADRVMQDDYERAFHAAGRGYDDLLRLRGGYLSGVPDAVLYPRGEDEVLAVLELAAREKIGVVPFGGGTAGGAGAGRGRVTIDLSGLDQIREIDAGTATVLAEAGITTAALDKALAARGFSLVQAPQDCEFSTLGGWIASDRTAGGLVAARLATPMGILDTQYSSGPDLTHLLAGSQGALGIITQARLRIRPAVMPAQRTFQFGDFSGAIAGLREAARAGLAPRLLHLSDTQESRFERSIAGLDKPRSLLQRLSAAWTAARQTGSDAAMLTASFADDAAATAFGALIKKHGGASLAEAPARQWQQNRFLTPYTRDSLLDRGVGMDRLDIPASWPALPALYAAVRAALDKAMRENAPRPGAHGLVLCHLARANEDGATLCFTALFPRQLENEIAQAKAIRDAGLAAANMGAPSPVATAALRGLKAALDPNEILK